MTDRKADTTRTPDTDVKAVAVLERLLRDSLDRASQAEQAAAMWQERARTLEAQVAQLLALPAHEESERPVPSRASWWRRLWRATSPS